MSFGYPSLYANGLNSNSQIRRSTDMVYQRGGTYEVVLTGSTYYSSMELDVDIYVNDSKVGRMSVVPYKTEKIGAIYYYRFNVRPYYYLQNYTLGQPYTYYWLNDWYSTNNTININNPYPNSIKANFKYGYRYIYNNQTITEYTTQPTNNLNHFTSIPSCLDNTSFIPSGFTNTGNYFNFVNGQFQLDNKYYLPNFDQEVGTVIGTGFTINTLDVYRRLSPMSQYLMDYPTVPEQSEASRFLTDAPRIQYIQASENYTLSFLNGQTGDRQVIEADYAVFEFYDENNNQIDYFEQQINFSGTTYASPTGFTDNLSVWTLPCGPVDITNLFAQIDFTNIAYYRVQLFYSYPTDQNDTRVLQGPIGPVSEAFYFYLYDNCLPENTRVVFLNSKGGYDYFTFRSYRQDSRKINMQTYDSRYYATDIQGPDRDFARTLKTFDVNVDQEIVLESEYLNVPYANWLEQLFSSPQVYIQADDFISPIDRQDKIFKDLRPVQVISTEVDKITKKHKKLNKYRITFKSADNFFANKGF